MNEQIRVRFTSNGQPLAIVPDDGGIVLQGETSASPRRVLLQFDGFGAPTKTMMDFVRQRMAWRSDEFPLNVTLAPDGIVIAGTQGDTLPPGLYDCRLVIDDLTLTDHGRFRVDVKEHSVAEKVLNVTQDGRHVRLTRDVADLPAGLRRLLTVPTSRLDDMPALDWLNSMSPRASRKACLMNILAKLSAERAPLLDTVTGIFFADVDRIYTEVTPECASLVQRLADDPGRPFIAEGRPKASVHLRILDRADVSRDKYSLRSFRQQGSNSLQIVSRRPWTARAIATSQSSTSTWETPCRISRASSSILASS